MLIEAFDEYTSHYDMNNPDINLKYNHSYRVMKLNERYAKELGFTEEDIELARIIGLLHDFGRFEQLRVYHSYDDVKTVDHADYSVEQLFDKQEIKKFTDREEDYEIIKFAIKNHNKFRIPECSNERMLKHAKLIRDSDKVDIIFLLGYLGELNLKAIDASISEEMIESIKKHSQILRRNVKNENDSIASKFAFTFDINNDICLTDMKKNLEYLYKQIDGEEIFKEVYEEVNKYIDGRLKK